MSKRMKMSYFATLSIFLVILAPKLIFSEAPGKAISIGEYRGDIYESSPKRIMWMVIHIAFGRPLFIKEFHSIDEYGLKSCFMGAVSRDEVQVQLFRLIFRSEDDAIKILDLVSFDSPEVPVEEGEVQTKQTNFRDANSGFYTDGTSWCGYKRIKNMLVLAGFCLAFEDLQMILDGLG